MEARANGLGGGFSFRIPAAMTAVLKMQDDAFQQFLLFDFQKVVAGLLLAGMEGAFQFGLELFRISDIPGGQNSFGVLCNVHGSFGDLLQALSQKVENFSGKIDER